MYLTQQERAQVQDFYRRNSWYVRDISQNIELWLSLIDSLETSYVGEWHEYTNSLDCRMQISKLIDEVDEPLKSKLLNLVRPCDARFLEATVEAAKELPWTNEYPGELWQNRIPKNLEEGCFAEFLRKRGYI